MNSKMLFSRILVCAFALLFFQCTKSNETSSLFTLLDPETTGLTFNNQLIENDSVNIMAYEYVYNGGGIGVGDFNNDGLPDVYLSGNMVPGKLFINRGNMKF